MINSVKNQIDRIDRAIREGRHADANRALDSVLAKQILRDELWLVAGLCRRLSRSKAGVGLLNPIVRPSAKKPVHASDEERAEYAACLIRLGVLNEAHALLDQVSESLVPRALLFRAFAHIARWDFEKSEIALNSLLNHRGAEPYDLLIARVNLGVGHVFLGRYVEAQTVLEEASLIATRNGNRLMHANSLELMAQAAILSHDYSRADAILRSAEILLTSSKTIDAFFIRKDQAILQMLKAAPASDLSELRKLKAEALSKGYWEQNRDCDYYISTAMRVPKMIHHLYFGTPFPAYRGQLLRRLGWSIDDLPETYRWRLPNQEGNRQMTRINLDILTGDNSVGAGVLKVGQVQQRLLAVLASDFYRPSRLVELFNALFPNDYFSPDSSGDRIYQAMRRLRSFFNDQGVPIEIRESSGFYRLVTNGINVELLCYRDASDIERVAKEQKVMQTSLLNHKLLSDFLCTLAKTAKSHIVEFKGEEMASVLGISKRMATRHLKMGVESGLIARVGAARKTRYRWTPRLGA